MIYQSRYHLLVVTARRDQLAGRTQEEYATSIRQAERQLKEFIERNRNWNLMSK